MIVFSRLSVIGKRRVPRQNLSIDLSIWTPNPGDRARAALNVACASALNNFTISNVHKIGMVYVKKLSGGAKSWDVPNLYTFAYESCPSLDRHWLVETTMPWLWF